jgi:RimJ/RimL family protein N-acetyltransferase
MPWAVGDYGRDQARAWIESPTDAQGDPVSSFLIFEHGVLVGSCGIHFRSATYGEIGYWVRTSATGRGIATAAILLLARHGFDELRLSKIFIRADPANGASQRVAVKAGGRLQGEPLLAPSGHTHPDGSFHELVEFVLEPKDVR